MKKILLILFIICGGFVGFAQKPLRVNYVNFYGTWYSTALYSDIKKDQIVRFYRIPSSDIKDSIKTTFNISRDKFLIYEKGKSSSSLYEADWDLEGKRLLLEESTVNTGIVESFLEKSNDNIYYTKSMEYSFRIYSKYVIDSLTQDKIVMHRFKK